MNSVHLWKQNQGMNNLFFALLLSIISFQVNAQAWNSLNSGTNNRLQSTFFVSNVEGWVAGDAGTILYTSDGGNTWAPQAISTNADLQCIFFASQTRGYVSDVEGKIYGTTDGGIIWTELVNLGFAMRELYFITESTGWAVGQEGRIYRTDDSGITWNIQNNPNSTQLNGVHFSSSMNGCAVGDAGVIYTTTDGGTTWTLQTSGTTETLSSVYFTSATEGHISAHCSPGKFLKTTDGGASWSETPIGIFLYFHSIFFIDANNGWAAGDGGFMHVTSNGGTTWSVGNSDTTTMYDVHFPSSTIGYAVGDHGEIIRYGQLSGVDETSSEFFSLYPNPANDFISILSDQPIKKILVTNSLGKTILTPDSDYFFVESLPCGVYFIVVTDSSNHIGIKPFIKN